MSENADFGIKSIITFFLKTKSKNPMITFVESINDGSDKAYNFVQYQLVKEKSDDKKIFAPKVRVSLKRNQ